MNGRGTTVGRPFQSLWLGMAGGLLLLPALYAGEPIQFSSPSKDVNLPTKKASPLIQPDSGFKWRDRGPSLDIPLPPPVILIDPRQEQKWREQREQKKNWLMQEPELFRDKFKDPFAAPKEATEDFFTPMGAEVERLFGKSGEKKEAKSTSEDRTEPLFSDRPLFEHSLFSDSDSKSAKRTGLGDEKADEKTKNGNDSNWTIKSLFDPQAARGTLPVQPGMSLYEMLESTARDNAAKKNQEERRKQFTELLNPIPAETTPALLESPIFDPINSQKDLTRQPLNPIMPMANDTTQTRSPFSPAQPGGDFLARPDPGAKFSRPLPFENLGSRSRAAVEADAENKTRQMRSLNLISRPTILEIPERRF